VLHPLGDPDPQAGRETRRVEIEQQQWRLAPVRQRSIDDRDLPVLIGRQDREHAVAHRRHRHGGSLGIAAPSGVRVRTTSGQKPDRE
jgi:hypothetical protein